MLKTKTQPERSLLERIAEFRAELDSFIDEKAEALKADCPGVPFGVLRNVLTARSGECQCHAVRSIMEQAE